MSLFAWFLNNQLNSSNFFQLMSPFYHICSLLMKAISLKQIIHRQLVSSEQKMFKCPQCGCLCNFLLSRLSCVLRFAWTPEHWSIPPDHPKLAPLVVWVEQNTRALCWWSSPEEHLRPRWEKGWEDWSERREVGTKGHVGHHRLGGGHHHHPYMDKGDLVIATIIILIKRDTWISWMSGMSGVLW